MAFLGGIVGILCVMGALGLWVRVFTAIRWHYFGAGERAARAEFGRLQREGATTVSEPEFVHEFVSRRAGPIKNFVLIVLLSLVGIPLACTMVIASH